MNATLFAVILSLSAVSFHAQAALKPQPGVSASMTQVADKINLNKADAHELTQSFKGIGQKRAEAIVSYRAEHGNFKSVDDLAQVRGIGKNFVTKNLKQLQEVFVVG